MAFHQLELEGIWEDILQHTKELSGRRVHLTVLADEPISAARKRKTSPPQSPAFRPPLRGDSTVGSLLKHAGTWAGNDFEECLQDVYLNRSKAKF